MNTSQMSHLVTPRVERIRGGVAVDVAIVGAGAAATLLVTALRRHQPGATVTVVGTGHSPGRGVAYSTTDAQHRMNVPVRGLSVDADGSDHLPRWLAAHGHQSDRDLPPPCGLRRLSHRPTGRLWGRCHRRSRGRDHRRRRNHMAGGARGRPRHHRPPGRAGDRAPAGAGAAGPTRAPQGAGRPLGPRPGRPGPPTQAGSWCWARD